ncbi:GTP-binding protein [Methanofollis fontis]|uniref:GTP-binding protein n=1 Tax=Methanofollis fontis TaxID=2052832 RepID=A0A483CSH8_9EURY|nr:GTP-binding protein [Methanofollis fontis]TAJ43404.1 GTP-binding protein [Methanofollis fontis]
MIYTGVEALDEMLGGGVPKGRSVFISLEPGVDGQGFMFSALKSACAMGKRCLVIAPFTTREAFLSDLAATPYRLDAIDRLRFLDSSDYDEIDARAVDEDAWRSSFDARIDRCCSEGGFDAVFIYCNRICDEIGTEETLKLFLSRCRGKKVNLFVEYLNLYDDDHLDDLIAAAPFDLSLSIGEGYGNLLFINHFRIHHAAWTPLPSRQIPFVVRDDGSLSPQIPKIVVTGPVDAGKTTFIQTASETWVSSDRLGMSGSPTTVAMDFGHPLVTCRGFEITLVGTPGQEHFGPIIAHLLTNATGVIFVVDGRCPDDLGRARQILNLVRAKSIPFVMAANKRDLPGMMSEDTIRRLLSLPPDAPVIPISALRREDTMAVIDRLIRLITREPLSE